MVTATFLNSAQKHPKVYLLGFLAFSALLSQTHERTIAFSLLAVGASIVLFLAFLALMRLVLRFVRADPFTRYGLLVYALFIIGNVLVLRFVAFHIANRNPSFAIFIFASALLCLPFLYLVAIIPPNYTPKSLYDFRIPPRPKYLWEHLQAFLFTAVTVVYVSVANFLPVESATIGLAILFVFNVLAFPIHYEMFWITAQPIALRKHRQLRYLPDQPQLPSEQSMDLPHFEIVYGSEPLPPRTRQGLFQLIQLAEKDKISPQTFWNELQHYLPIIREQPESLDNLALTQAILRLATRWGNDGIHARPFLLMLLPPLLKKWRIFALLPKYLQPLVYDFFEFLYLTKTLTPHWEEMIHYEIKTRRSARKRFPLLSDIIPPMDLSLWKLEWNNRAFFGKEGLKLAKQDWNAIEPPQIQTDPWTEDLDIAAFNLFSTFFGEGSKKAWGGSLHYPYEKFEWVFYGNLLSDYSPEKYQQQIPQLKSKGMQRRARPAKEDDSYTVKLSEEQKKEYLEEVLSKGFQEINPSKYHKRKRTLPKPNPTKTNLLILAASLTIIALNIIINSPTNNFFAFLTFGLGIVTAFFSVEVETMEAEQLTDPEALAYVPKEVYVNKPLLAAAIAIIITAIAFIA